MSYTLQAIILEKPDESVLEKYGLVAVKIQCNMYLVPLTYEYVQSNKISFLPLTDEGLSEIEGLLLEICLHLSLKRRAVYVEAEIFGGEGTQGCALFENCKVIENALENESAINYALKWLGVSSNDTQDEFTVVGLGMQRNTEDWLNA